MTATIAMTGAPSAAMAANDTENPSSVTPTRSSFLVRKPSAALLRRAAG